MLEDLDHDEVLEHLPGHLVVCGNATLVRSKQVREQARVDQVSLGGTYLPRRDPRAPGRKDANEEDAL